MGVVVEKRSKKGGAGLAGAASLPVDRATLAGAAIRWILGHPEVSTTVLGMHNPGELQSNLNAATGKLAEEDPATLRQLQADPAFAASLADSERRFRESTSSQSGSARRLHRRAAARVLCGATLLVPSSGIGGLYRSVVRSVSVDALGLGGRLDQYPSFFQSSSLALSLTPLLSGRLRWAITSCFVATPMQVPRQHVHRRLVGSLAGPEVDQHAGDDRAVDLDLDSLGLVADQSAGSPGSA